MRLIPGWFDWEPIYHEAVRDAPKGAVLVEIGVWLGKSTSFMAAQLAVRGRTDIAFFAVDTWKGSPNERKHLETVEEMGGDLWPHFVENMRERHLLQYVKPLRMLSEIAAQCFHDGSVDFVFVDGCHQYEAVATDIKAWLPKLKAGGIMAGHDYQQQNEFPGVTKAVKELLPGVETRCDNCWYWRKPCDPPQK